MSDRKLLRAITSENVELLKKMLQKHGSLWDNINYFFDAAIETGNMEILKTLMQRWPFKNPYDHTDVWSMEHIVSKIPELTHNEATKLDMIQYLLPYCCKEDPKRPGFYPTLFERSLFQTIVLSCMEKHFTIVDFFINNFYVEKYNYLYPLIKRIEAAVDGWQHICILLHKDFWFYNKNIEGHLGNVVETFLKLLMKNTRESEDLAIETMQVLLHKDFCEVLEEYIVADSWDEDDYSYFPFVEKSLSDPLVRKLLFQLIFKSINDDTQKRIYYIIDYWVQISDCNFHMHDKFKQSIPLLNPFISEARRNELCDDNHNEPDVLKLLQKTSAKNGIRSLKELSGEVIRCKVRENVKDAKKLIESVWKFNLPVTVKCFLLYIPDPAWMDGLEMS